MLIASVSKCHLKLLFHSLIGGLIGESESLSGLELISLSGGQSDISLVVYAART